MTIRAWSNKNTLVHVQAQAPLVPFDREYEWKSVRQHGMVCNGNIGIPCIFVSSSVRLVEIEPLRWIARNERSARYYRKAKIKIKFEKKKKHNTTFSCVLRDCVDFCCSFIIITTKSLDFGVYYLLHVFCSFWLFFGRHRPTEYPDRNFGVLKLKWSGWREFIASKSLTFGMSNAFTFSYRNFVLFFRNIFLLIWNLFGLCVRVCVCCCLIHTQKKTVIVRLLSVVQ